MREIERLISAPLKKYRATVYKGTKLEVPELRRPLTQMFAVCFANSEFKKEKLFQKI